MPPVFKPLAAAVCGALLAMSAHAKPFDQAGTAPAQLEPVGTYAAGAPVRSSLKSLVPKDWQIMVHRNVQLPETMDWSATDTWPQVLSKLAEKSGISVLVDWERETVFLRPESVALEDTVRRVQVTQAARTPLPALGPDAAAPVAAPQILAQAKPPIATVDKGAVDALTAKVVLLERELSRMSQASAKPQPDQSAAVAELKKDLAARNAALQSVQGEMAAAKAAAEAARKAAESATQTANSLQSSLKAVERDSAQATAKAARASQDAQTAARQAAHEAVQTAQREAAQRETARIEESRQAAAKHAAQAQAAQAARIPVQDGYRNLTLGQGFNREPVKTVAAKVAELHGATLDFQAGADIRFPGPVTILGADLGEDVRLMMRALGPDVPVRFDLCRMPATLRVTQGAARAGVYSESACAHPPMHLASAPSQSVASVAAVSASPAYPVNPLATSRTPVAARVAPVVLPAALEAPPLTVETVKAGASDVAASAVRLKFSLEAGADLEDGLRAFFKTQGYSIAWVSNFEFKAAEALNAEGVDLAEVLTQFLPKMGLDAEINTTERSVRIGDKRNEAKQ